MNSTIPGLPLATTISAGDLFELCASPATTPVSQRITIDTITGYVTNKVSGYVLGTNLFPSVNVGSYVLDPAFNAKMRIGIGNGEAGFQIQQNDVGSFSFFEFFDPDGVSVAALDQSANFRCNGGLNCGGDFLAGGQVQATGQVLAASLHANNGFNGTFQVLTALPSTFKTVTVVDGIITGVA